MHSADTVYTLIVSDIVRLDALNKSSEFLLHIPQTSETGKTPSNILEGEQKFTSLVIHIAIII